MTDRHAGYLVTLDHDMGEDDAEAVLNALRMVRGVLSAEPIIADFELQLAQTRARGEYYRKVVGFLQSLRDDGPWWASS